MKQPNISWHPAFIGAIQLELEEYRDVLEFLPEYQLSTEPLRIDCLVIKKAKGVVIKKNIAAIFREVNLLEYKSPDDYVSVEDFYKVYAYACLYASLEKTPITNMTITFIESHYPRELLAHLSIVRGFKVAEEQAGVYTISGDILPIQVIDSRKLSIDENLWLKGLSNRLDPFTVVQISGKAFKKGKDPRIQAYLYAIAHANIDAIKEAINMSNSGKTLEQVFEEVGWIAKWEARGEAKGEAKGEARGRAIGEERKALEMAKKMLASGFPLETVASITELDPEKVKELYQGTENKEQ